MNKVVKFLHMIETTRPSDRKNELKKNKTKQNKSKTVDLENESKLTLLFSPEVLVQRIIGILVQAIPSPKTSSPVHYATVFSTPLTRFSGGTILLIKTDRQALLSQQMWHNKDLSLLIGLNRRTEAQFWQRVTGNGDVSI
jgi:hypothetical protein